jgi:hypothetical protein
VEHRSVPDPDQDSTKDVVTLTVADKYLLCGLLLRKRRTPALQRKVLAILQGPLDLDARIEALLRLHERAAGGGRFGHPPGSGERAGDARGSSRGRRRQLLLVDPRAELLGLLRRSQLKRGFSFARVGESLDALPRLRPFRVRLLVVNECVPAHEYARYLAICRAIEPAVRLVFLGPPAPAGAGAEKLSRFARVLGKPLNMGELQEAVATLLSPAERA